MGVWGAGTIEHHFWSEGYEVAPAPGAIQAYWAAITKNIHVGVLGYVMATHNPIRVAEEIAVIDHLAQGRSFVGLARGYQSRWTNVIGQHYGARATKSPQAAIYNPATAGRRLLHRDHGRTRTWTTMRRTAASSRTMSRSC